MNNPPQAPAVNRPRWGTRPQAQGTPQQQRRPYFGPPGPSAVGNVPANPSYRPTGSLYTDRPAGSSRTKKNLRKTRRRKSMRPRRK